MNVHSVCCPYCYSPFRQVKWGRTPAGSQKYRCHHCNRAYTPHRKSYGHPDEIRETAIRMYLGGNSCLEIGLHLGVHRQSVANWIYRYHQGLPTDRPAPHAADLSSTTTPFDNISERD